MAQSGPIGSSTTRDLHDAKDKGMEQMNRFADKATDQLSQAASSIEDAAGKFVAQGRQAGERMGEVAGNMQAALDKSVREQPMATLAVVAAAGFVLGALWKS